MEIKSAEIDKIESMLIMLMDGKAKAYDGVSLFEKSKHNKNSGEHLDYDCTELVRCSDMVPASAYTVDMTTDDRLFSVHPGDLMCHPSEIIGDQSEACVISNDGLKWLGYRKCKSSPRGVSSLGKVAAWYELHYRVIKENGSGTYQKRFVALSGHGFALPVMIAGIPISNPSEQTANICLACSLIEDAHRSNAVMASVIDSIEVKLPVPIDAYKDIFALRDAPLSASGKRKAIFHWVAKHMRNSSRGNTFSVEKHTRGVQEFVIDGIKIRLDPNN